MAPRSVQVTWRGAPAGSVRVRVAGHETIAGSERGTGAVEVHGLEPDTEHRVEVVVGGRTVVVRARTLPEPAGRRLARIATLSDLHLGERAFGLFARRPEHPPPEVLHPERCARAALAAAVAWGAELVVLKGDLTHRGRPEEWDALDALLAEVPVPVLLMAGNHDHGRGAGAAAEELARRGHPLAPVRVHDHGGLRLVLLDTTGSRNGGALHPAAAAAAAAHAGAWDGPVLVCTHHHLHRLPVGWFWPPGVPKRQADHLLDTLAAATPRALVTSGHTHRHRRHHRAVPVTEVGSPKDFPGVWAGYDIHEDGIVQVVRRIEDPDCIAWTESCRHAVAGWWGRWSPGTLDQRCLTLSVPPAGPVSNAAAAPAQAGRTS